MKNLYCFLYVAIGCLMIITNGGAIDILLKDNIKGIIFNASVGYDGCYYEITSEDGAYSSDVQLKVNQNGIVEFHEHYLQNFFEFLQPINFNILIKDCGNGYSMDLPVSIYWKNYDPRYENHKLNISVAVPVSMHHNQLPWVNVLDLNEDNRLWVPAALRRCNIFFQSESKSSRSHHNKLQVKTVNFHKLIVVQENLQLICDQSNPSLIIQDDLSVVSLNISFERLHKAQRSRSRRAAPVRFTRAQYSETILENLPVTTKVFKLPVTSAVGRKRFSWIAIRNRQSSSMFNLNETTGEITAAVILDREVIPMHQFRVTVTDKTNRQSSCILKIVVNDVNDNTPLFESSSYNFKVTENEGVDELIARVAASDRDAGANADVTISFVEHSHPFKIYDGDITVKSIIDREVKEKYSLSLIAKDNGNPSLNSTVPITITVLDLNDNSPKFTQNKYTKEVHEGTRPNSVVATVKATDPDKDDNGNVKYSLLNARGVFSINRDSGDIRLITPLDFENDAQHEFHLIVRASDGGKPPKSSSCIVAISVIDNNDNKPIFIPPSYTKTVDESLQVRSNVLTVTALDSDSASNSVLTYSILSSITNLPFIISKTSGDITLKSSLDYEKVRNYAFTVRATDTGGLFGEGFVNIYVRDVNDNPPVFEKTVYTAKVQENASSKEKIIDVMATDEDSGSNVNYWISRGNEDGKFTITKSGRVGVLSLSGRLDYAVKNVYRLTLTASDGKNTNTATVIIQVIDKNTHRPVFLQADYEKNIREDVKVGKILKVSATDEDQGENARLVYEIQGVSRLVVKI